MLMSLPILFLSYHFPPIGGPGVQRSLKFVRYLPDSGFQPIVVAGPARGQDRYEPEDASLLAELQPGVVMYRSASLPPECNALGTRLTKMLGRSGDRFRWWCDQAWELGLRAAREHNVRLVFVTAAPFEGISAAVRIGRELDVPVIADLRDPWALDEVMVFPTAIHRRRLLGIMGKTLSAVDLIVMNTPEAEKAVREAFPHLASRCRHVTNGYDPADFQGVNRTGEKHRFVITHAGYLHTDIGRRRPWLRRIVGGELVPVDHLSRSVFFLLKVLELLGQEQPGLLDRLKLNLVGPVTDADRACVERSSVRHYVHLGGYVTHQKTIEALVNSDLLFLPMHGLPRGTRARIVPAKLYEYLGSGRPILAAVPEGDARDFILEAMAGRVVEPSDVDGMARALRAFLEEAPTPSRPEIPEITRFSRRILTESLARHIRQVVSGG